MSHTWRRLASAATAALVVTGGLLFLRAGSANAFTQIAVNATTWAYTDAMQPFRSHVDESVPPPVGVWRDAVGKVHLSRSYFTFDISQFAGATVPAAEVVASERSV